MELIIIMEESKTSSGSSKFQEARERISSTFIGQLGTLPQRGSPSLVYTIKESSFDSLKRQRYISVPPKLPYQL